MISKSSCVTDMKETYQKTIICIQLFCFVLRKVSNALLTCKLYDPLRVGVT